MTGKAVPPTVEAKELKNKSYKARKRLEDPKYRAAARVRKPPRPKEPKARRPKKAVRDMRDYTKIIDVGGEYVTVYQEGYVAQRLHMGLVVFARLVDKGYLPAPTAEESNGDRWYSKRWVLFTERVIKRARDGARGRIPDAAYQRAKNEILEEMRHG